MNLHQILLKNTSLTHSDSEQYKIDYSHPASPIENFKDPRIAGLQALFDFVMSHGGRINPFNSADLTQFFRKNKSFSKGFELAQDFINPVLMHALPNALEASSNFSQEFDKLALTYSKVLKGEDASELKKISLQLKDIGIYAPSKLLEGKIMEPSNKGYDFNGKRVIVTGADTGIGREIAFEFLRRNASVVLHYPTYEFKRGAMSVVEIAKESGKKAYVIKGDFRKMNEILKFADSAINKFRGVDILVNNAGITMNREFGKVLPKQFDTLVNVNNKGNFFVTQKACEYMRRQRQGTIINLASPHSIRGKAGNSVYAMTKGGVMSLTRELAIELSQDNIRVNAIMPGWCAVENHFKLNPACNFYEEGKNIPRGYISRPIDIAKIACFLASKDADYITGQTIIADGGANSGLHHDAECFKISNLPFGRGYVDWIR